ncbi:MAG: hypothetical protein PHX50_13895 [Massilibacteroides sp.]|nr:hypothetical protein [Massilibacteroides sp.]
MFENIDNIYNKIAIMLTQNQNLAKLLYYPDKDALSKPDLTQEQIFGMLDQNNIEGCRIFNIAPTYYVTEKQRAEIRIYEAEVSARNEYVGRIRYSFDIVCHQELWTLADGRRRVMQIASAIVKQLNGKDVGSIGKFGFYDGRRPDVFKYQFYNDVMTGYKLFGFLNVGTDSNECY